MPAAPAEIAPVADTNLFSTCWGKWLLYAIVPSLAFYPSESFAEAVRCIFSMTLGIVFQAWNRAEGRGVFGTCAKSFFCVACMQCRSFCDFFRVI